MAISYVEWERIMPINYFENDVLEALNKIYPNLFPNVKSGEGISDPLDTDDHSGFVIEGEYRDMSNIIMLPDQSSSP